MLLWNTDVLKVHGRNWFLVETKTYFLGVSVQFGFAPASRAFFTPTRSCLYAASHKSCSFPILCYSKKQNKVIRGWVMVCWFVGSRYLRLFMQLKSQLQKNLLGNFLNFLSFFRLQTCWYLATYLLFMCCSHLFKASVINSPHYHCSSA